MAIDIREQSILYQSYKWLGDKGADLVDSISEGNYLDDDNQELLSNLSLVKTLLKTTNYKNSLEDNEYNKILYSLISLTKINNFPAYPSIQKTDKPSIVLLKGDKGDMGDVGATGSIGNNGTDGTDGDDGSDGREIELRATGTQIQWRYVGDITWINIVALSTLKGADGADGDDGSDGAVGPQGPTGAKGDKGDKGDTGAAGESFPAYRASSGDFAAPAIGHAAGSVILRTINVPTNNNGVPMNINCYGSVRLREDASSTSHTCVLILEYNINAGGYSIIGLETIYYVHNVIPTDMQVNGSFQLPAGANATVKITLTTGGADGFLLRNVGNLIVNN